MNSNYLLLPHFDPSIFTLGDSNIGLRWYGLMYLLGFVFARWLAVRRANRPNSGWTVDQVDSLLFNGFMGCLLADVLAMYFSIISIISYKNHFIYSAFGKVECRSTVA